jgi:tetratricopeptide (TPR) repeat protein
VQAVLGARIDALEPPERDVLDHASLLGPEFAPADLPALSELCRSREEVRAALLRLGARRLIEPGRAASFRFSSGLIQEVTYTSMSKRARADGHRKAAELASVRAAGPAAVGGHLERAHGFLTELGRIDAAEPLRARAAAELGAAGAQALSRADLLWADDLLTRSTTLHRPGEPGGTAALRRLGEVRAALGRSDEGCELLRQVQAAPGDPVESAHARLALAAFAPGQESPADAASAVLPLFEAVDDQLGQARACLRLAQRSQTEGRHQDSDQWLTRALEHAVRADGEPERAAALGAIGISLWRGPVPVPAALDRGRALLAEHGVGRRAVRITLNCPLAVLAALQQQWAAAHDRLAQAARLAEELGYAETRAVLPLFAAMVDALAGRQDAAHARLREAADAAVTLGAADLLDIIDLESARLHLDGDEVGAARSALARVVGKATLPYTESIELDGLLARIAAADGRRDEALRRAESAVRAAERTDSPVVRGTALLDQAHVARQLGLRARAADSAARAASVFATKGHLPGVAWSQHLLDERKERP